MTTVLLAVDDTEASHRAARTAHALFGDQADYLAINVADAAELTVAMAGAWGADYSVPWGMTWPLTLPAGSNAASSAEGADALRSAARATADDAADEAGVPVVERIGELGDPVEAILRAGHERAVDVIVVGASEQSWFARLLHPSVAKDVIHRADLPVLVVK